MSEASYVPESLRRVIFDSLHSMSHPGIRATQRLVTSEFCVAKHLCRRPEVGSLMSAVPASQSLSPHNRPIGYLRYT